MQSYLLLLAFPLLWPWIAKRLWNIDVTLQEMLLNIIIVAVVSCGVWYAGKSSQSSDQEIWNGVVTSKAQTYTSCSHSYSCNCTRDSKGSESCDTCYEHSNDWDWDVYSTAGEFTIDRVDRQGSLEPPRWTVVQKEQPVALSHKFVNYVKAVPQSLFNPNHQALSKFGAKVPSYPGDVYDYQYLNRILTVGVAVPDTNNWNNDLAMMLRYLGPAKQVNVIVVFTNISDPTFEYALQGKWLGAKKNDVVVIVGSTSFPTIDWVRIVSWTDNQLFKVELRDALLELKTVDKTQFLGTIKTHISKSFKRKQMKDFEYLQSEIVPPDWVIVVAILIATLGSILLSIFFVFYDVDLTRKGSIILPRNSNRFRNRY